MTKIGEGGNVPPRPTEEMYHKQLDQNIATFQNALESAPFARTAEESEQLKSIMNQQMELIQANVNEIKRLGIHKQGDIVNSDYHRYRGDPSPENRTALQQDMATLKEYNYRP